LLDGKSHLKAVGARHVGAALFRVIDDALATNSREAVDKKMSVAQYGNE
jgi:hypothetical protein